MLESEPGLGATYNVCIENEKELASVGIEPTTFALLARRSNQLS